MCCLWEADRQMVFDAQSHLSEAELYAHYGEYMCVCVGGGGGGGRWRVVLQDRSMTMKDGLSFQVSKFEVVKSDSLNFHFSYIWQEYWGV